MRRSLTILSGALLLVSVASSFGDTFVMQCHKNDCVRARCDGWGENCSTAGYFRRSNGSYVVPHSQQVCNEFGDCHFAPPSYPPQSAGTNAPPN